MNLYESVRKNLKESIGGNIDETVDACINYYTKKTGSSVKSNKKAHNTGGGFSHSDLVKVEFTDGTVMRFYHGSYLVVELQIWKNNSNKIYEFTIYDEDDEYKDTLDEFIKTGKISEEHCDYIFSEEPDNRPFDVQDAIDNKGELIYTAGDYKNEKEKIYKMIKKLPEDFPVIYVRGMWNSMADGRLTTLKELIHNINDAKELELYDNLLFIQFYNTSEYN